MLVKYPLEYGFKQEFKALPASYITYTKDDINYTKDANGVTLEAK